MDAKIVCGTAQAWGGGTTRELPMLKASLAPPSLNSLGYPGVSPLLLSTRVHMEDTIAKSHLT